MVDQETKLAQSTRVETAGKSLESLLRRATSRLTELQARALRGHGMTAAEWRLLSTLHDAGPLAPSLLAERMAMTRGGISKLVDRLRAKQFVVRASDRRDGRMQVLALTGAGARLVSELADTAAQAEADFLAPLDSRRCDNLRASLIALGRR